VPGGPWHLWPYSFATYMAHDKYYLVR